MTMRLLPPIGVAYQTIKAHGGRTYTAAPGSVVDAPDQDAFLMMSNGWMCPRDVRSSGPTSARPTKLPAGNSINDAPGYTYLDTTLGYAVVFDGATWRNPDTGAAV